MADFQFNMSKGRMVEFYNRVKSNDPSTSVFKIVPVDVAAVTDATIKDFDTLALVLSGGVTERSASGWARKVLTDSDLAAFPAPDDSGDTYKIDFPDQTWTAVSAGNVTDLIVVYMPDTAGADSTAVPCLQFDFAITPDGSDITVQINASGVLSAA